MDQHPQLVVLRRRWNLAAVGAGVPTVLLAPVAGGSSSLPPLLPLGLVAGLGAAAVLAVIAIDRLFAASPPEDDLAALRELRSRLLAQAVIAEAVVLVGAAIAFAFGPRSAALVGGVAAVVALVAVRPTPARMRRFDAAWSVAGRDVSLQRALERAPTPP